MTTTTHNDATGRDDMTTRPKRRETFRLDLQPTRDDPPTMIRLRRLLKALLRGFGFRCVAIRPVNDDDDRQAEGDA
jgi:hypothetical protein